MKSTQARILLLIAYSVLAALHVNGFRTLASVYETRGLFFGKDGQSSAYRAGLISGSQSQFQRGAYRGSKEGYGASFRLSDTTTCGGSDSGSSVKEGGDFSESFVAQKNHILLEKLENPEDGDITAAAISFVNFCDESFNLFLNDRIAEANSEEAKQRLGKVRYEINSARQQKLMVADQILRGILAAGGLKQMEAKLSFHLRRAEIDMAFMVILELNIEDAVNHEVEKAVQIMTHLKSCINEHQDEMVSPPVRLMRLLMRTDDPNIRKQMLRQKLLIGDNVAISAQGDIVVAHVDNSGVAVPQDTAVPQCEHIVVPAEAKWGGANVDVHTFRETIADVLAQMSGVGGEQKTLFEIESKCSELRAELDEVMLELTLPKRSDQCED